MDMSGYLDDQKLKSVFQQFDTDSSGKITHDNIYLAF
jgi:Ca2+-binding EF-hand superfamily protein